MDATVPKHVNLEMVAGIVSGLVAQVDGKQIDPRAAALVAITPCLLSIACDMRRIADSLERREN